MAELLQERKASKADTLPAASSNGQFTGLGREVGDMAVVTPRLMAYNFGYLALVWAVALGGIAVFWAHPAWYTFALAFLLVSSRHQALLNAEHEAIHRKFVRTKRWNDFVGRWFCAAPAGSPYGASKARHLSHHRLLATPEDPDHDLHAGPDKRSRTGLAKHFIGGLVGGYAGMVLMGPKVPKAKGADSAAVTDLASLVVVQGLLFGGFTLLTSWWVYPALWVAPLVTVTVLFHLVRSFVEHAVTDEEMESHSNRLITIPSHFLERALVAPYNMNYHAEHHLLPSVPAPRLPQLRKKLEDRDDLPPVLVRPTYGGALMRYMRALRD